MVIGLSVGPSSRAGRVVLAAGCGLLTGSGVALLVATGWLADGLDFGDGPLLDGRSSSRLDLLAGVVGDLLRLQGLCGLPIALAGGYLLIRALRRAAWLDGTRLSTRGALLTRTVDLSRASVTVDGRHLVAFDPVTSTRVPLPLAGLTPYDLGALADAAGPGPAADRLRDLV